MHLKFTCINANAGLLLIHRYKSIKIIIIIYFTLYILFFNIPTDIDASLM